MNNKVQLYQKIQQVSIEVMNLEKDMEVGSGNFSYKAVSDTQVTLAVKRAEEKNKIVSIPTGSSLAGWSSTPPKTSGWPTRRRC